MKKWYQSKTYWLNILVLIVGYLSTNIAFLQEFLGNNYGVVVIIIGIVNIILRQSTHKAIEPLRKKDV